MSDETTERPEYHDLNKFMATGILDADPITTFNDKGKAFGRFTLVVVKQFTRDDGTPGSTTTYVRCVAYGKRAELIGEYAHKGSHLYIEGELGTHSWEDQQTHQKHTVQQITVSDFLLLDRKEDNPQAQQSSRPVPQPQGRRPAARPLDDEDDLPF